MKLFKKNKVIAPSIKFLRLPMYCGAKEDIDIFVNPTAITTFGADTKGRDITHIGVNGNVYAIHLPIEKFIKKIQNYETENQDQ